jgi:hypothetical protein
MCLQTRVVVDAVHAGYSTDFAYCGRHAACSMCCPRVGCGGEALQLSCLSIIYLPLICVAINSGAISITQHLGSMLHPDSIPCSPCMIIFKYPANQFLCPIEDFGDFALGAQSLPLVRTGGLDPHGHPEQGSDVGPQERAASITRKSKLRST